MDCFLAVRRGLVAFSVLIASGNLLSAPLAAISAPCGNCPVILVSIDGLRPDYVTKAEEHGLKIPTLRSFVTNGTYAEGVRNVLPASTYPNHTTLITGVSPSVHGVVNNTTFDPLRQYGGPWFWYGADVHSTTLFEIAHAGGLKVGSVSWPATVSAPGVDFLIPEYWRIFGGSEDPNDHKLIAALSLPAGMLQHLEAELEPYKEGHGDTLDGDRIHTRFAIKMLQDKHLDFLAVHLTALDTWQHREGPFSLQANETLEKIDGMLGQIVSAAKSANPSARIFVVSDHGFTHVEHEVNLSAILVREGLLTTSGASGPTEKISDWKAAIWGSEGSAAVILRHAEDVTTRARVEQILNSLAADPANGILRILNANELKNYGAYPSAGFAVFFRPGYALGNSLSGELVTEAHEKGAHGYTPDLPDMHSSFFAQGGSITQGKNLGEIDMRSIAPTIAKSMHLKLSTAEKSPLF